MPAQNEKKKHHHISGKHEAVSADRKAGVDDETQFKISHDSNDAKAYSKYAKIYFNFSLIECTHSIRKYEKKNCIKQHKKSH